MPLAPRTARAIDRALAPTPIVALSTARSGATALANRQPEWRDRYGVGNSGYMTADYMPGSPGCERPTPVDAYIGNPAVQAEWDKRYADSGQLWSGQPNGALVAQVAGLTPGRALDVGCGEGADAVWLARNGWDVTALEVSGVAIERAAGHATDAGVVVRWLHAELAEAPLEPASFDLVSAQYPALLRTPDAAAERALLSAVAPGGLLLLVHHAGMETEPASDSGVDPADYVWPSMVAELLNDDWTIELYEQRPRTAPDSGAGARHAQDLILRARRLH
jgi:SAM-dependent methyltransferase